MGRLEWEVVPLELEVRGLIVHYEELLDADRPTYRLTLASGHTPDDVEEHLPPAWRLLIRDKELYITKRELHDDIVVA